MKRLLIISFLLVSCSPGSYALDNSASGTSAKIDVLRLSQAIYIAEGGIHAKKPYGILSVKCEGKEQCGRICRNTIRNNLKRWSKSGGKGDFIDYLGKRYAPIGCDNDNGLNRHWQNNVRSIYGGLK